MARNVGYLSGTDSATLSQLAASGVNTLPFSNGWDNHGKNVSMVAASDNLGAIVGYFHKLACALTQPDSAQSPSSGFLDGARIHGIPVVVVCPANVITLAMEMVGDSGKKLHWVTPDQVYDKVMELVGPRA
jgi:hypothetical protein